MLIGHCSWTSACRVEHRGPEDHRARRARLCEAPLARTSPTSPTPTSRANEPIDEEARPEPETGIASIANRATVDRMRDGTTAIADGPAEEQRFGSHRPTILNTPRPRGARRSVARSCTRNAELRGSGQSSPDKSRVLGQGGRPARGLLADRRPVPTPPRVLRRDSLYIASLKSSLRRLDRGRVTMATWMPCM